MNIKTLYISVLIFCLFSCSDSSSKAENITKEIKPLEKEVAEQRTDSINFIKNLFQEINLIDLKKEYGSNSTSAILPYKNTYNYSKIDSGFYGMYFFPNSDIDKIKTVPINMKIVIYTPNSNNNWNYSDTTEKLIELVVYDSSYTLSEKFKVGDSKDLILSIFGTPTIENQEYIAYHEYGYGLVFYLDNYKIHHFVIGKYNHSATLKEIVLNWLE